jgi:3-phenylpropionate/trans-cinnamate dioxygenase ferredoxin reductase subunit
VLPNAELAAQAQLTVNNGIVVDAHLLTSDPAISAIGDVASFPAPGRHSPSGSSRFRMPWTSQALAARLTGKPASYAALPWFWTDQGELKLQIAGL